jgi:Protein of unknown function (DUF2971)
MLYKYVNWSRKTILVDGLMRFSQPSVFNDPFDLNPNFTLMADEDFDAVPFEQNEGKSTRPTANQDAVNLMLRTMALGIQVESSKYAGSPGTYSLRPNDIARSTLDSIYGVLSLTDNPKNLLMWAHYANCHSGLVLQIDDQHDFFSPHTIDGVEFGLTKVDYSNLRPVLSPRSIKSPTLLYRKSPEWAYESEWRLIRHLSDANKIISEKPYPIALFQIPFDAIKGVIVGVAVSHEERVKLFELLGTPERKNITIFQTRLSDTNYELEIHPPLDGKIDQNALNGRVLPPNINLMITIP